MGESVELEGSKWMKKAVGQNLTWMEFNILQANQNGDNKPMWIADMTTPDTSRISQVTQTFKTFIGLHELQKTNTLCDITIKIEEKSFPAHRVVLAAGSEYFNLMFTKSFQESCEPELTLKDAGNPEAFDVLLNFLYCGELNLSAENVTDVIKLSHYLQMDVAMKRCEHFIHDILESITSIKLVTSIYSAADMFDLVDVQESCEQYLARNFKPTDEFLMHITMELMKVLLKRLDLKDEREVFDTTVAWLHHDWIGRKDFAPQLFALIRLGVVPVGHLSLSMMKYPSLYAIPECRESIERVMTLIDSAKPGDGPLHILDFHLFATRTTQDGILVVNSSNNTATFYDQRAQKWLGLQEFPNLPDTYNNTISSYQCFTLKGNLYIVQGERDGSYYCPRFLRLDTQHKKLLTLATMNDKGRNPCNATFIPMPMRNQIVAIGGSNSRTSPCNVEIYDVEQNEWHKVSVPFRSDRYIIKPMSGVVYNDYILAYIKIQSGLRHHCLRGFHLHPEEPRFSTCLSMMTEDHPASEFTGLVANEGKCYRVAGGSCTCTREGCQWHKVCVHELVIDENTDTARVGDAQDQSVIPETYRKNRAFCINQDVYVILFKKFFKVERVRGSDDLEREQLGGWYKLFRNGYPESYSSSAMLAFDPVAWQAEL